VDSDWLVSLATISVRTPATRFAPRATPTFRIWGLGFGVWGLGFGVWGLGFGVWGLGFWVWGLGVWGLRYRVQGSGSKVCPRNLRSANAKDSLPRQSLGGGKTLQKRVRARFPKVNFPSRQWEIDFWRPLLRLWRGSFSMVLSCLGFGRQQCLRCRVFAFGFGV